jgi:hypothetical protein
MKSMLTIFDGEYQQATVFHDGELYAAVAGHHPNFNAIVDRLEADPHDESVVSLFDIETTVRREFQRLTPRVTVRDGEVFLDGDSQEGPIVAQILRFIDEGHVDDLEAVVNFMEKVETNPNENCRKQLFRWLENNEFTIDQSGDVVGYKGCNVGSDGVLVSSRPAPESENVTVDDEQVIGYVPQIPGSTVEMPRSVVDDNPYNTCSVGLHVANFRYANDFGQEVVEVRVNPRDFVSVTTDYNSEKIRCCRYTVVGPVNESYTTPVLTKEADKVYRDTRDNYLKQERYPKGHPKAGQFKPKG